MIHVASGYVRSLVNTFCRKRWVNRVTCSHVTRHIQKARYNNLCAREKANEWGLPSSNRTGTYTYIYLMFMHTRILCSSHICIYMHVHTPSAFSSFYICIHHHHALPFCDINLSSLYVYNYTHDVYICICICVYTGIGKRRLMARSMPILAILRCDVTHSFVIWLIHGWRDTCTWRARRQFCPFWCVVCDMNHSYVNNMTYSDVTWRSTSILDILRCDVPHSCMTRLVHVWRDTFMWCARRQFWPFWCVVCDMNHSYVTWLVQMWHDAWHQYWLFWGVMCLVCAWHNLSMCEVTHLYGALNANID